MTIPRYDYMQPGVQTVTAKLLFSSDTVTLPKFGHPVSVVENFKRAARRERPYWIPNPLTDMQSFSPTDLIYCATLVSGSSENTRFRDWFGADWTHVVSAGGPMLTPGVAPIIEDITKWEKTVNFPDLKNWDFETHAKDFMTNSYDPEKVLCTDIGIGCTERLVSLMGGYTEAMLAFATEPEACADFFERFIDFEIDHFNKLLEHYPVTMITYHDDWGNEKDTFFSSNMLEDMIFKPTKRFFTHIKSRDVIVELHSCGNINRFIPYMIDLGVDFMQIQRRVVDFPAVKDKYGDKIGLCGGIEGLDFGAPAPPKDELIEMVRHTIDALGSGGGLYLGMWMTDPEALWHGTNEIYAYSSEKYAAERGEQHR